MKTLHKLIFIYILINFISLPIRAKCLTDPNLIINSKSAILMTHQTSNIIYEKNAYDKFYPASTTKILTLYILFFSSFLEK